MGSHAGQASHGTYQADSSDGSPISSPPVSSSSGLSDPPESLSDHKFGSSMDIDFGKAASPIVSPVAPSPYATDSSDDARKKPAPKTKSRGKGKKACKVGEVDSSDADDSDDGASKANTEIAGSRTSRHNFDSKFASAPGLDTRLPIELMTDITVEELIAYYPIHVFQWPGLALLITHCMMRCGHQSKWTNRIMDIINESRGFNTTDNMITRYNVRQWLEQTLKRFFGEHYSITQVGHDNALKIMLTNESDVHSINELLNKHLWDVPADRKPIQWKDPVPLSQVASAVRAHPEGHFAERALAALNGKPFHMPTPLAPGELLPVFASIPENLIPLPAKILDPETYPIHITPMDVLRHHWKDLSGEVFLYVLKEFTLTNLVAMYMEVAGVPAKDEKATGDALRKRRERAIKMRAKRNKTDYQTETVEFALEMHAAGHYTAKPRKMTDSQTRRWRDTHPATRIAESALDRLAKLKESKPRGVKRTRAGNTPPPLPKLDGDGCSKDGAKKRKLEKQAQKVALVTAVTSPPSEHGMLLEIITPPAAAVAPPEERVWDPVVESWKYPDLDGHYVLDAPFKLTDAFLDELLPPDGPLMEPAPFDIALIDPMLIDPVLDAALIDPVPQPAPLPDLTALTEDELFALFMNEAEIPGPAGDIDILMAFTPKVTSLFPPKPFADLALTRLHSEIEMADAGLVPEKADDTEEQDYEEDADEDVEMAGMDETADSEDNKSSGQYSSGDDDSPSDHHGSSSPSDEDSDSEDSGKSSELEEGEIREDGSEEGSQSQSEHAAQQTEYYLSIMAGIDPDDEDLDDLFDRYSSFESDRNEPVENANVTLDYGEGDSNEARRPLGKGLDYEDAHPEDPTPAPALNPEDSEFYRRFVDAGIFLAPGVKRKRSDDGNEASAEPAGQQENAKKVKINNGAAAPAAGFAALAFRPRHASAGRPANVGRTMTLPIRIPPRAIPPAGPDPVSVPLSAPFAIPVRAAAGSAEQDTQKKDNEDKGEQESRGSPDPDGIA